MIVVASEAEAVMSGASRVAANVRPWARTKHEAVDAYHRLGAPKVDI